MNSSSHTTLAAQVGLLIALCVDREYFTMDAVTVMEPDWEQANESYGEAGLPSRDAVIFNAWAGKPVMAGLLTAPEQKLALPFTRCAAATLHTLGPSAIDMILLLIGPEGSAEDPDWLRAAALIEIDDRVCRKLVWLPSSDITRSADEFLARSPFARPWRNIKPDTGGVTTLNRISGDEDPLYSLALEADRAGSSPSEFVKDALSRFSQ